jgi:hypothetical protein
MGKELTKVVFRRIAKDSVGIVHVYRIAFFLNNVIDYEEYCDTDFAETDEHKLFITTKAGTFVILCDFPTFDAKMNAYLNSRSVLDFTLSPN